MEKLTIKQQAIIDNVKMIDQKIASVPKVQSVKDLQDLNILYFNIEKALNNFIHDFKNQIKPVEDKIKDYKSSLKGLKDSQKVKALEFYERGEGEALKSYFSVRPLAKEYKLDLNTLNDLFKDWLKSLLQAELLKKAPENYNPAIYYIAENIDFKVNIALKKVEDIAPEKLGLFSDYLTQRDRPAVVSILSNAYKKILESKKDTDKQGIKK